MSIILLKSISRIKSCQHVLILYLALLGGGGAGGVQQKCYETQKAEPGIGLNKGTVIISIKYFRVLAKTMD